MSQTVKAIRIHETGGPDVMRWENVDVNEPHAEVLQLVCPLLVAHRDAAANRRKGLQQVGERQTTVPRGRGARPVARNQEDERLERIAASHALDEPLAVRARPPVALFLGEGVPTPDRVHLSRLQ